MQKTCLSTWYWWRGRNYIFRRCACGFCLLWSSEQTWFMGFCLYYTRSNTKDSCKWSCSSFLCCVAMAALLNKLVVLCAVSWNITLCIMFGVDEKQACELISHSYSVAAGLGNKIPAVGSPVGCSYQLTGCFRQLASVFGWQLHLHCIVRKKFAKWLGMSNPWLASCLEQFFHRDWWASSLGPGYGCFLVPS